MKIKRITTYEVIVPAGKNKISSEGINKPLHKLPVGAKKGWSVQFDELSKLIVKIELANDIVGWGELYRGHRQSVVEDIIRLLLHKDIENLCLQKLPFAFCREYDGFECAVWDTYARLKNMRVVDLLGGAVSEKVKIGAWSGHRKKDEVGELASAFNKEGYDCIKFKTDLDDDVVSWCREIAGYAPGMQVILDPNERWEFSFETRKRMDALREVGNVLCLEDPIPRWKLNEYALLRNYSSIPIVLHVSLPYMQHGQRISDAIQAISLNAVDGFNFNGGIAGFQILSHIAFGAGLPCWHGSEVDLGILEAMYIHKSAAAEACIWPGDIFGRMIREHDLLKEPLKIDAPYALLPSGPGLGVEPDEAALKHYGINSNEYF